MKNILNRNNKGQYHGYQKWYSKIGKLTLRCNMKNGLAVGYVESHITKANFFFIK